MSLTSKPPTGTVFPAKLRPVLERAADGDVTALPELKKALDDYPELVDRLGNLAVVAKAGLVNLISGKCVLAKETLTRYLPSLHDKLAASVTSELERLLVDRICLCWLEAYHANFDLSQQLVQKTEDSRLCQAIQKRVDRAHARFLASIKTLATVQKLVRPLPSAFELLRRPVNEAPDPVLRRQGMPADAAVMN